MPYIKKEHRNRLIDFEKYADLAPLLWEMRNAGELNYMISQLLKVYISFNEESYQTYNDIVGALECAKLEIYRRRIIPYEEKKIAENGDINYNNIKSRCSSLEEWIE